MGFLNFLSKFSFIAYGFNERRKSKQIKAQQFAEVMAEKETMEEQLEPLERLEKGIIQEARDQENKLMHRTAIANRDEFLDDRGLSRSQVRSRQLGVLKEVVAYNNMFDSGIDDFDKVSGVRENWFEKLECYVVIKKKKVKQSVVDAIWKEFHEDMDKKDLAGAIQYGCRLKESYVFNDAQIIVNTLSSYGITAKAVSVRVDKSVDSDSKKRNPDVDIPKIAKAQRFLVSGLWMAFMLFAIFYQRAYTDSILWLSATVGTVLLFLLLWLLTKPIVALAIKIVELILRKGSDDTKDSATYLRGIFLTELFDKGLDMLDNGIIKFIDGVNKNYGIFRKWALTFLTPKILDDLLYEVINQMETGASFNEAINNAEAKADRKKAEKRYEERMRAIEQENIRHNIEMEKEARARADYARQCANNSAAAANAMKEYAYQEKRVADAENETAKELKKIRRGF